MDDIAAAIAALPDDRTRPARIAQQLPAAWAAMLVDVEAGRVADDEDCTPLLDVDAEHVPVAQLVWAMERTGLVRQPGDGRRWALTELGKAVLVEARGDGSGG
jgi:hypothetical protein